MFFCNDAATTEIYTLSLHDALPISQAPADDADRRPVLAGQAVDQAGELVVDLPARAAVSPQRPADDGVARSEEHTSELQSRQYLVCRLLLEKKKKHHYYI